VAREAGWQSTVVAEAVGGAEVAVAVVVEDRAAHPAAAHSDCSLLTLRECT